MIRYLTPFLKKEEGGNLDAEVETVGRRMALIPPKNLIDKG